MTDQPIFSLLDVTRSIQKTLGERYKSPVWIKAELNKLNYYKQSGHCFPELLEKQDGRTIAQMKATIWKDDFIRINNRFLEILKEPVKDGIKILFLATISFDPSYGLSLKIMDIDPSYTLGDLEKEKQETIQKLRVAGIFEKNKIIRLAKLPQRIAVISVGTSKGYIDFTKIIGANPRGYLFFHMLFPSILQGERAVTSIIAQLRNIYLVRDHFDAVAIIRGGGDDVGLSCYNHYALAKEIAEFPIPVLTGIGHATNETVCEMISAYNAITPTKLAEWLIHRLHEFADPVDRAQERITEKSLRILAHERNSFRTEIRSFRAATENILNTSRHAVMMRAQSLFQHAVFRFKSEKNMLKQSVISVDRSVHSVLRSTRQQTDHLQMKATTLPDFYFKTKMAMLENIEKNIYNLSPENVLKRGYSITLLNGKAVKSISEISKGDVLHTILYEGTVNSKVSSISNSHESSISKPVNDE